MTGSIAAVRGWAYAVAHVLYDWRGKTPEDPIAMRRLRAAEAAGLVTFPGLGLHYVVTDAGRALLTRVEQGARRRTERVDHAIRRALGEDPKPGTWATLTLMHGSVWRLDSREHGGVMIEWSAYPGDGGCTLGMTGAGPNCPPGYRDVPALEGVTDPAAALRAIHERLVEP